MTQKPVVSNRAAVALNCAAMMQHGVVLLLIAPLIPEIMTTFDIDEGSVGLLLSMGSLGFMAAPIIAGSLIDRSGVRAAFITGTAIEIAFFIVFGLSPFFWLATAAYFFSRFGASFIETGANVLPSLIKSAKSAHSLMNFVHLFFSLGAFVGPILIGVYLNATSMWRPVLFLVVVPTGLLLVLIARVRLPRADATMTATMESSSVGHIREALQDRMTLFGALALFFYVGAEVGISAWIVLYLQNNFGMSTVLSSTGLSVLWLCVMIGRYVNSILGNRLSTVALVSISGIGGCIGVILLIFTTHSVVAFLLLGWVGLCLSGVFPNVMAEVNRRDPAKIGAVTAVMSIGASAGAAVFQWLIGICAETLSLRFSFFIPAALQLCAVAAFLLAMSVLRKAQS